jgi:hypothetical protein
MAVSTMVQPYESTLNELIDDLNTDDETDHTSIPLLSQTFQCSIRVLPVDLFMNLATNHLNIHEIRAMMNVCKLWYQIFRSDVIWKPLFMNHVEKNKEKVDISSIDCLHPDAEDVCFLCGQQLSPHSNSSPGFVIVSSPQQLAKLLSIEKQRIELMESNRLGDDNRVITTPTKGSTVMRFPQNHEKLKWNLHLAIPSSFLAPNSTPTGCYWSLESRYSHLDESKWYFRYKQMHSEDFCSKSWKSLSESWKWLRSALRDRLYLIWKASSLDTSVDHSFLVSASTITRATAKLTSVNWIRFYETLKEEMMLQADALASDLIVTYSTLLSSISPLTVEHHLTLVQHTYDTCQLFISWCDELDALLIPLNCHLSDDDEQPNPSYQPNQRYKRSHLGEIISDSHSTAQRSPHIGDLCSILLRRRCLLQWEVCTTFKSSLQVLCHHLEEIESHQWSHESLHSRVGRWLLTHPDTVDSQKIINTLLQVYDLIQALDVPDDTFCSHFRYDQEMNRHLSVPFETRNIFRVCYYEFLTTQQALISHLREHDRTKENEIRQLHGVIITKREQESLMGKYQIESDKRKRTR